MELQRHLLEENDVAATGAELTDVSTEITFEDDQSDGMKENKTKTNRNKGFTSATSVVQELEKRVDKNTKFFITIRRQMPLARILNLWRYEAKRQGGHHEIRVKFLGKDGIDSEAVTKEFFTEVIPAIGITLFSSGSPIDSILSHSTWKFKSGWGNCGQQSSTRRTAALFPG